MTEYDLKLYAVNIRIFLADNLFPIMRLVLDKTFSLYMQIQDFEKRVLQIKKFFTAVQDAFCDIILRIFFLNAITLYKTISNERLFNEKD